MGEFGRELANMIKVAVATLFAFLAGELKAENEQMARDLVRRLKESKTDAKTRDDVAGLSDSQLDDELRHPPRRP